MAKAFILLMIGLSFASCPSYPYHDYVTATAYTAPIPPPDTILQYCNLNLGAICILSNALNTTEDKKLFIAEFIANDSFDQIRQWNQGIAFGKYPANGSRSSTNIKDAWVSLAYLDPSVYDNGTYLINASTQPLIRYNFTFVVDTRPISRDCNDIFNICGYSYSISTRNTSSSINVSLSIISEYQVDRYQMVQHCNEYGCWESCDYFRTDIYQDSLNVSDSKKINLVQFIPTSNYSLLSYYNGLVEVGIFDNDSNLLFQIGSSSFYKTNYSYKIRTEAGPYNILLKEIVPGNETSLYGMSLLGQNGSIFNILAPYSEICSLKISDHFSSQTLSGCNISNLINSTTIPQITPVEPAFFGNLLDAILLGIVAYIAYLIAKKAIANA